MQLKLKDRVIEFPRKPLLMGIINVNDDSFSNDGTLDIDEAIEMAIEKVEAGADVIDVGAESARTNREVISVDDEVARFLAFMSRWSEVCEKAKPRDSTQIFPPVLSVNTWRSEVVERVLAVGGELLNDMSALPTSRNAELAKEYGCALLIMHSVGEPKVAHTHQKWKNVMEEMREFFQQKIELASLAGVEKSALLLDPGVDFAKQCEENLTLYHRVGELQAFGCAVMLPVSRKTVIGDVLGIEKAEDRDAGTLACIVQGVTEGVQMFRVHNVAAAYDAVALCYALGGESNINEWA